MIARAKIAFMQRPVRARAVGARALLLLALVPSVLGGPVRLTVPFTVDRTITASGMAIELEADELGGRPVSQLKEASPHPSAAVLQILVGHLAANQPEAAAALLRQGAFQSPEDGLNYARNFAKAFQEGWSSLVVRRRYNPGQESWFSWEVPQGARTVSRIFRFAEQDGKWLWADELQPSPLRSVQTLVSAAEQLVVENQPGARAVEGMTFKHAVTIPGMQARWLFNGFSASWDAFGNGPVPDHPVTKAYATAAKALYGGDFESFAGAYLPFSAQRMRDSLAQMDDAQKASFAESNRQLGRKVTFVLEASPIFLVFYETDGRGMQYDTLFAAGGDLSKLRFANFFVETFIDEIMKDRGFFQDPVIRPLAGRIEDPPQTATLPLPRTPPASPGGVTLSSSATSPQKVSDAGPGGMVANRSFKSWIPWLLLGLLSAVLLLRYFRPKS